MKLSSTLLALAGTITSSLAQNASTPGYVTNFSTLPGNTTFSFGEHYAVLNLDLINGIVGGVNETCQGQKFIKSVATWISAVHALPSPPLTIFTRIYFSNTLRPEIGPQTPFAPDAAGLGNATFDSPQGQLFPAFKPAASDVILQKTRYYAGAGNGLEEILSSQLIDTVVLVSSLSNKYNKRS